VKVSGEDQYKYYGYKQLSYTGSGLHA